MGFFDLFKKKENNEAATNTNATPGAKNENKTFDYFAFSVKTDLPKMELGHNTKDVKVQLENELLNVYYKGQLIGNGDNQALKKYNENCIGKKMEYTFFCCI